MADNPIIVRRLSFNFPAQLSPVIIDGQPEESFIYIGFSLLLPHLEPYLIRSMSEAKKLISDQVILTDIDAFNGQESQHYRLNHQFNRALDLTPFAGCKELEKQLAADYLHFTKNRSLRFNLAYAEGFEAGTMAATRFNFQFNMLERVRADVRELFCWHLSEELEHRTVAFDVYQYLYGNYFYRLVVGLYAQWHLSRFVIRVILSMVRSDQVQFRAKFGGRLASYKRLLPLYWLMLKHLLPKILGTHMPWYSPHHIALPEFVKGLLNEYSEQARSRPKNSEESA